MKRVALVLVGGLLAALAGAVPVAVVQGSESVAAGERRFAAALARHVERWYREAGVETALSDDANLPQALAGKKVAVLVYLSQPAASQVAALSAFTARGGKLIVPTFALERAQEFIYALKRLELANRIPEMPVFVDSPRKPSY